MKLIILLIPLAMLGQTTQVGGIATTPDVTTALTSFVASQISPTTGAAPQAIGSGDATVQLPAAIVSACLESYAIVTLSSASNVSTLNVQTFQVPISTRVTITGALTAAYNATFATTSVATNNSGLTIALSIADGTYSNASPQTNGYPKLVYARCAVLIDSEVIGINGTTDGTAYAATRGDLGTAAASHSQNATMTMLKYASLRSYYRSTLSATNAGVLAGNNTALIAAQLAIIAAAQAQIKVLTTAAQ